MNKLSFNENWTVSDGKSEKKVTLPYDAMMHELRSAKSPNGSAGGYYPGGKYVYKKKFIAPNEKYSVLESEGVYGITTVLLNGKEVYRNVYGYNNFFVDLTNNLHSGENEIEVIADNSAVINSRWYSGSGIYRDVWLYTGYNVRIVPDGVRIEVTDIERKLAKCKIEIDFESDVEGELFFQLSISTDKGKEVCRTLTPYTVFDKGRNKAHLTAFIRNPKLWNAEKPNLYRLEIGIIKDGETIERETVPFGIRKIQLDPLNGLRVNGRNVLLRGACIHHDNGVIGANEYYEAAYRRIKILKEAGFNAVRISHHPASKAMLEACDKLGMYVLDETFDMWGEAKNKEDFSKYFGSEWKKVLTNTVKKDFNHPCVIMYSIGNEIPEIIKPEGKRISRELSDYLRTLDNTRPITNAINGLCATTGNTLPILLELGLVTKDQIAAITGDPDSDNASLFNIILSAVANGTVNDAMTALAGNLGRVVEHKSVGTKLEESVSHLDVCGYNYMMSRYAVDQRDYPDRVLLGSETFPPEIDLLWEKVKQIPQLIGDFTWTGWDYIGEAGVGHTNYAGKSEFSVPYPGYLAYCGDIDVTGYRRPISYLREIVFGLRKEPYISVQHPKYYDLPAKTTTWAEPETIESWTFAGYEGKNIKVKVYADAEEVLLYINGKEAGRKKPERMRAEFDVIYEVGEIKAIALKDGKQYSHLVKTAGESKLKVSLSNKTLSKGEICYVECEFRDSAGVLNMDSPRNLTIKCTSNIEILGFGTGDPCATDNFFDNTHTTFNGRAVAVIRAISSGDAAIRVISDKIRITKSIKII